MEKPLTITGLTSFLSSTVEPKGWTRRAQRLCINIAHGRIADTIMQQGGNSSWTNIAVTDARVALESVYQFLAHLENSEVCVQVLNKKEDAMLWIEHLARLRSRAIRSGNHVILIVDDEDDTHSRRYNWAAYNTEN